jgi:hypothetical protein
MKYSPKRTSSLCDGTSSEYFSFVYCQTSSLEKIAHGFLINLFYAFCILKLVFHSINYGY